MNQKGSLLIILILSLLLPGKSSLDALPEDPQVVEGEASFHAVDEQTLHINASDRSIIQYESFNIGENETVQFFLPDSQASSLNRILRNGASDIAGNLLANGKILLVNSNGIQFGPTARVETGGFIASALNIRNQDFLEGRFLFSGTDQIPKETPAIINQGRVTAQSGGAVFFIAPVISNQGVIQAPLGTISLISGDLVTIAVSDEGLISVGFEKPVSENFLRASLTTTDAIHHKGTLQANGGQIILKAQAASEVFHHAMNLEGIVQAGQMGEREGSLEISSNGANQVGGSIEASTLDISSSNNEPASYTFQPEAEIRIARDIVIQPQVEINGANAVFEIGRNFVNQGIFHGDLSTVVFSDASQSSIVSGDNDFHNLEISGTGKKVFFETGKTQKVNGALVIQGSPAHLVEIRSTDPGQGQWSLELKGSASIQYARMGDAVNLSENPIKNTSSNSFGNNLGWEVGPLWVGKGKTSNWSEALNWNTGVLPGPFDLVTFDPSSSKNSVINSTFGSSVTGIHLLKGYTGILSQSRSLALNGDFFQTDGTFDGKSQTLSIHGRFELAGGTFLASSGNTSVAGDWIQTDLAHFNARSGTFTLNGTEGLMDVPTFATFNNLTLSVIGTKTISIEDTLLVTGNLILSNGNLNGGRIQALGNVFPRSGFDGGNGTIEITGDFPRTIQLTGTGQLPNVTLDSEQVILQGPNTGKASWDGDFILKKGQFVSGLGQLDFNGDLILEGGSFTAPSSVMSVAGSFLVKDLASFSPQGGTLILDGNGTQMLDLNRFSLDHLTYRGTGAADLSHSLSVNGTFTQTSGVWNTKGFDMTVEGLTSLKGGTYLVSGGRQNFRGGLIVSSAGALQSSGGMIDIDGSFLQTGGSFIAPPGLMTVSGDFLHTGGIFEAHRGTVLLDGIDQKIAGDTTFHHLTKKNIEPSTLTFDSTSIQTILGALTLEGNSKNKLHLRSDLKGALWKIDAKGRQRLSYVDVKNSYHYSYDPILCLKGCSDRGDNINWFFELPEPPAGLSALTPLGVKEAILRFWPYVSYGLIQNDDYEETTME